VPCQTFLLSGSAIRNRKDGRLPQTSPSKRPAAQVAFAKKAADAKARKGKTSVIAPDLIDGNEQELAEEALAAANRPARKDDGRSLHAARAPPARLDARLLSKREVLAIVGVSYPTLWSMMRANTFPRSRVVGGKSMWLSSEIEAWLAALPVRQLKGDEPKETAIASLSSGSENNRVCRGR
jgi:predicted DNA-binding transcriptional regulator AlpA